MFVHLYANLHVDLFKDINIFQFLLLFLNEYYNINIKDNVGTSSIEAKNSSWEK